MGILARMMNQLDAWKVYSFVNSNFWGIYICLTCLPSTAFLFSSFLFFIFYFFGVFFMFHSIYFSFFCYTLFKKEFVLQNFDQKIASVW